MQDRNPKTGRFQSKKEATQCVANMANFLGELPDRVASVMCPGEFDPFYLEHRDAPTNTTKTIKRDAAVFLSEAMAMGGDGSAAIEAMEARGQRELVETEVLPTKMDKAVKEALESLGFKFLGVVEGDNMFQRVEFPKGWKKVPTDHSMWSNLVDDKGRERASIFYKAAFYDRDAFISCMNRRYSAQRDRSRRDDLIAIAHAKDGDKIIFSTREIKADSVDNWYKFCDALELEAVAWLDQNYPDWKKSTAYWD